MGKKISKNVKKQLLNILFLAVLIGITLVVLFLSNRELNFENIGSFLSSCDPWWIVAAFAVMLLFIVFEGLAIHFILRGLGERPRLVSSMVYSSADVYYSAITPSASGGQPASAYYMVKDGIPAGKASFALVFNLIGYTTAILVIGAAAFAIHPDFFSSIDDWFTRLLIILGFVVQSLLLAFFVACMFCGRAVNKCGNWIISLLVKIKLVKKPEKWRGKLADEVEKYRECRHAIREHAGMSFANFFFNLAQRVSHVLVSCFVCLAAAPGTDFWALFVLESFVLIGYNSVPLPGGVGAFEYLYLNIYCVHLPEEAFILSAMMVTRVISYYLRMFISGVFTLVYHGRMMRRARLAGQSLPENRDGSLSDETKEKRDRE